MLALQQSDPITEKMDPEYNFRGSHALLPTKASNPSIQRMQLGFEERKAAVREEMRRMNQLPPNSAYATHRLHVLNKTLQLMSIQRNPSEEEELEKLLARLSL